MEALDRVDIHVACVLSTLPAATSHVEAYLWQRWWVDRWRVRYEHWWHLWVCLWFLPFLSIESCYFWAFSVRLCVFFMTCIWFFYCDNKKKLSRKKLEKLVYSITLAFDGNGLVLRKVVFLNVLGYWRKILDGHLCNSKSLICFGIPSFLLKVIHVSEVVLAFWFIFLMVVYS